MTSWIKEWIINICTALFFITAAELILPDNSLKKFSRFVLGLILLIVILNPIISLFKKGFNINSLINKNQKIISDVSSNSNGTDYSKQKINNTVINFQNNLNKVCEDKLKSNYKKINFKADVKAEYDSKKNEYSITEIKIGYSDNSIKKVKKIEIGKDDNDDENAPDENMKQAITELLYNNLGVSESKIKVYKM